ncbi:MAG TPA: hypothetical protein H9781_04785, partial [Candidatus Oscillibacter excrementavium]|nr:hypothetical protein [Candidatus Oscillibacter excrementavium]
LAFSRTLKSSGKRLIENERHPSWVSFVAIFLPVFPDFRVSRQPASGRPNMGRPDVFRVKAISSF